jgi:hypothetical protein
MRKPVRLGTSLGIIVALLASLSATGVIQAAQLVTFDRGQSIVVQSVEKRGGWYYFTLEGGGELGVPVNRVASIENYEPPPVLAAVNAAAAAVAAVAAAPPASPPATAGEPAPAVAGGQQAQEGPPAPPASQPNVAAQGQDDWRYKVKMSGGPKRQAPNAYGAGGAGARNPLSGRRVPPGGQRLIPPPAQQQNPQN